MLRIALKILLAVSLLLQGSVGAFAADTARAHATCHGMQHHTHAAHGTSATLPCCPPDCDMPGGMATCAACSAVLMVAPEFVLVRWEPTTATSHHIDAFFAAGHVLPPTRPPIA